MFQTKLVEKIKTHSIFNNFFSENLFVDEIMWKYMVEPERPEMIVLKRSALSPDN
jgi:hypothetical protein